MHVNWRLEIPESLVCPRCVWPSTPASARIRPWGSYRAGLAALAELLSHWGQSGSPPLLYHWEPRKAAPWRRWGSPRASRRRPRRRSSWCTAGPARPPSSATSGAAWRGRSSESCRPAWRRQCLIFWFGNRWRPGSSCNIDQSQSVGPLSLFTSCQPCCQVSMNKVKGFQALHSRGDLCCHVHQSTIAEVTKL